jgi:ABC-2 type transport system permease protein
MHSAGTILWAQWRTQRHSFTKNGISWGTVATGIWYGAWALLSLALVRVFSNENDVPLIHNVLSAGLLAVLLYWQIIPLLMASSGSGLELRKLRAYPIPDTELFWTEVLLRVTSGLEILFVLLGIMLGSLLNPGLPKWGVIPALLFGAFNLLLGTGVRDALTRVLASKRIREIGFFVIVMLAALPQMLATGSAERRFRLFRFLAGQNWKGWPWTATANLMLGSDVVRSSLVLVFWLVLAWAFARWQFRISLTFDSDAAGADSSTNATRPRLLDRFFHLPSLLLPDPMGALVEKDFRFLLRAPRFRLVFLMGFTFGLAIWLPLALGRGGPSMFRDHYLTLVSVYSLLLLSEVCFWNAFGFDRSAAQFYLLAPVRFSTVLLAKNVTAVFFVLLEISSVTLMCLLLRLPMTLLQLGEAFAVAAVVSLFMLAAGNVLSVRQARGVNPSNSFRKGSAARIQAMLLVVYPVAFAPVALAYLARFAFDSNVAFFSVLAVDAVLAIVLYRLAVESAVSYAAVNREKIVAALSSGDGPISE